MSFFLNNGYFRPCITPLIASIRFKTSLNRVGRVINCTQSLTKLEKNSVDVKNPTVSKPFLENLDVKVQSTSRFGEMFNHGTAEVKRNCKTIWQGSLPQVRKAIMKKCPCQDKTDLQQNIKQYLMKKETENLKTMQEHNYKGNAMILNNSIDLAKLSEPFKWCNLTDGKLTETVKSRGSMKRKASWPSQGDEILRKKPIMLQSYQNITNPYQGDTSDTSSKQQLPIKVNKPNESAKPFQPFLFPGVTQTKAANKRKSIEKTQNNRIPIKKGLKKTKYLVYEKTNQASSRSYKHDDIFLPSSTNLFDSELDISKRKREPYFTDQDDKMIATLEKKEDEMTVKQTMDLLQSRPNILTEIPSPSWPYQGDKMTILKKEGKTEMKINTDNYPKRLGRSATFFEKDRKKLQNSVKIFTPCPSFAECRNQTKTRKNIESETLTGLYQRMCKGLRSTYTLK